MLTIDSLTMKYLYGATAIKDLSLTIADGEHISLLSATEGGKTSLLKCIAGLYPTSSGNIILNNKNITNQKTKNRNVLLVMDDGGLFKYRSVRYNLEYPLKLRKIPKEQRKKMVEDVAKELNILPNLIDRGYILYPDDKVRVSFARSLLRQADIVMYDNIFNGLSSTIRKEVFFELLPNIQRLNSNVIFATNEPYEAFSVSDKIAVLSFGKLVQFDTKDKIINYPSTITVDKLVNPVKNRILTNLIKEDGKIFVDIDGEYIEVNLKSDINDVNEVICSFEAIVDETKQNGFKVDYSFYYENNQYVVANQLYIKTNGIIPLNCNYTINRDSVRIYKYDTEEIL